MRAHGVGRSLSLEPDGKEALGGNGVRERRRHRGAGLLVRGRNTGPPGREEAHPERHIREKRTLGFPF